MLKKLFTSKTRVKVIELLLTNPSESFHLRRMGRLTKLSLPSVKKELENLVDLGLVDQRKEGNMTLFKLNSRSPLYEGLKDMFFGGNKIYIRTTKNLLEPFDYERIQKSLMKETKLSEHMAERIAKEVEAETRKLNLNFLSAPLVRELVNHKLLVHGLEKERKLYTRVGMPVYDVTNLIETGSKENANLQYNPETVHKLMADQIAKEYVLVKVLPVELADAHMRAQIHVHDLDYFAMRPFCFSHDIRYFLKNGFRADGVGNHTAIAGPAKKAEVAFLHAAKILAAAQTNCAGGQGFSYFNTWLAPYIQGLDEKKVNQLAQMFVYEMSQMYVARGGQTVFSSIDCDMHVPEQFHDIPAVLPGGKVKDSVTYSNFEDETKTLFSALVNVYMQGDYIGKAFNFPKFEVQIYPENFKNGKDEDMLMEVSKLAAKFGTPYYIVNQPYMPEFSCYQCCAFLMPLDAATTDKDVERGTLRGGALQVVTINLPQLAYESKGNDNKLFELLRDRMDMAKEVLELKKKIIERNLDNGLLPFLSQSINGKERYLEPDKQSYILGLVGVNEMVKAHTGQELHESRGAWKFGLRVMKEMKDITAEYRKKTGMNFSLARTPAESCGFRLAQTDMRTYKDKAIVQGSGASAYYTNGFHVNPSANVELMDRMKIEGAFHPLTDGGAMSHIWTKETNPDPEGIYEMTKRIATKTAIQYYAYTKDLTVCSKCNYTTGGLLVKCPKCNSKDVDWWSRITGYYQNVSGWNKGKLSELGQRRRYGMSSGSGLTSVDVRKKLKGLGVVGWESDYDY